MPPPKSKVWNYFDRNVNGADCKLCKKTVVSKGGNTTNLAAHLRRFHQIECSPHPSVAGLYVKTTPSSSASSSSASCAPPPAPTKATAEKSTDDRPPLPHLPEPGCDHKVKDDASANKTSSLPSIWDRARSGKMDTAKQHRITRKMAAYLVKDMRPFATAESEYFRDMIHACDERIVIPNRDTFSQRIVPSWYNIEVAKLMEELGSAKHVALTSDCWTSRTTVPYLTITAHFFDDDFDLKSKVLQTKVLDEKHTGENISVALNASLESWKIEQKVSVITTDNASNMGRAIEISDIKLKIGCFAHTLDLAAKKAVDLAKPISKKMKPVISFLHRSHIGAKVFKEKQKALNSPRHKLITDVETRWNSTYLMFDRFFEQRAALHATFLDKRLETHKDIYRDFKETDVTRAEEFIDTMKYFYEMTLAVCSERNPTSSLILPLAEKVLRKCEAKEGDSHFSKQLKKAIHDNLSKRYQNEEVREFLLKATALDPRTKAKSIVQESTWNKLTEEVEGLLEVAEMMPSVSVEIQVKLEETQESHGAASENAEGAETPRKKPKTSLMASFLSDDDDVIITDSYKRTTKGMAEEEIRFYRGMPTYQQAAVSALAFWNINKYKLPNLAELAKKYLVAQATSVASERVFSTSGDILSAERACLDMDSLAQMIFLKKNASKESDFLV